MSSPQEIAMRLLEGGGETPSEEWQPPDDWLEVPEPEDYEINLLVNNYNTSSTNVAANAYRIQLHLSRPEDMYTGMGELTVDWGDGTVESYAGSENGQSWSGLSHDYTNTGQNVIKIRTAEQSCFLQQIAANGYCKLLIAKLGDKIIVNNSKNSTQAAFAGQQALCWVKFNGTGGLPENGFRSSPGLKRIDMTVSPKIIPAYAFSGTNYGGKFNFAEVTELKNDALSGSAFKNIHLPKCKSIGDYACSGNTALEQISAPICTSVGNNSFNSCPKLSTAEFSEDCVFGNNCFSYC
ncbi:MAG: leucine-rich repeat domain-containing protein, partial [Prevotella sp.]|nr:leucine-rich repeat domain-containing protein [Prevotella sp.]